MICRFCMYRFWEAVTLESVRLLAGGRPYVFLTLAIVEGFRCRCHSIGGETVYWFWRAVSREAARSMLTLILGRLTEAEFEYWLTTRGFGG